jgi:hypothetical protein
MNESADESDLVCLRRPAIHQYLAVSVVDPKSYIPKMTLQQFKTQIILSRGARYDLILSSSVPS